MNITENFSMEAPEVKKKIRDLMCMCIREGLKKIWIYPYLGGWVFQVGDNIHKKQKKTMPLKSILDHSKSF